MADKLDEILDEAIRIALELKVERNPMLMDIVGYTDSLVRIRYQAKQQITQWALENVAVDKENKMFKRIQKQKTKYNTKKNTYKMFPIGTRVQVITLVQDYYFFNGTEKGTVVKNTGKHLGIIVEFDKQREFQDGYIQKEFGFLPDDLIVLKE
ncbi:MAG: hypothetical protein QME51_06480 [Planctomycetota bacterium]|nr:hypothetical protein [Planctomycetota bacterium]